MVVRLRQYPACCGTKDLHLRIDAPSAHAHCVLVHRPTLGVPASLCPETHSRPRVPSVARWHRSRSGSRKPYLAPYPQLSVLKTQKFSERVFCSLCHELFSFSIAQPAASAITLSSSASSFSSIGMNFRSPLFPIAIKAFRRSPCSLARFTGDPRKVSRNSCVFISASQSSAGLTSPSLA